MLGDESEEFPTKPRICVRAVPMLRRLLCSLQLVNERKGKRGGKSWPKARTSSCAHNSNACAYLSISGKQSAKMVV